MKNEIGFVFPGQGSQKVGMGKEFLDFPEGKAVFEEVDEALGFKLSDIIFEGNEIELKRTENAQPALMAVSIAALRVLEKESGKKISEICSIAAGHSLGEYSALCGAGAFSLSEAALLLRKRGEFMAGAYPQGGAMIAIMGLSETLIDEIIKEAGGEVVIANDNAVGQIVLSGQQQSVEKVGAICARKKARAIPLDVSGPFHSPLLQSAALLMQSELEKAHIALPCIPVINNIFVQPYSSIQEIRSCLTKQITARVRWRETILRFESEGIKKVVEIGNGKVLSGLFKRTTDNITSLNVENKTSLFEVLQFLSN